MPVPTNNRITFTGRSKNGLYHAYYMRNEKWGGDVANPSSLNAVTWWCHVSEQFESITKREIRPDE